jgi:hypothetical protein
MPWIKTVGKSRGPVAEKVTIFMIAKTAMSISCIKQKLTLQNNEAEMPVFF